MSAVARMRLLCEVLGLGEDKKFAALFEDSSVPTNANGPSYIIPAVTTPVAVERGGIGDINTRVVVVACVTGTMWASPYSSANVTAMCYLSTGAFNMYTYASGVTAIPWIQAMNTTSGYEVWSVGVAS